jgi:hypothetical protein
VVLYKVVEVGADGGVDGVAMGVGAEAESVYKEEKDGHCGRGMKGELTVGAPLHGLPRWRFVVKCSI